MTMIEMILETAKKKGKGEVFTNATTKTLSQNFSNEFGEENELDGICWDDINIYNVGCYDGVNYLEIYQRNPQNGVKLV
jgi:hypothetical protein